MTTIKVPKSLRERVAREASREGITAASLVATLMDERDRQARFDAVRRAYAHADGAYAEETGDWDTLAGDGLVD